MKKVFALIIVITLAAGLLAGCSGSWSSDLDGHELVGQWAWSDNIGWTYVLNADGTGTRGGGGVPSDELIWRVRGDNEVRIQVGRGGAHENWTYALLGYSLTMSRSATRESYEYLRVGAPIGGHALTGTWAWTEDAEFEYIFNPDGSGTLSYHGASEGFTWLLEGGNNLLLDFGYGVIDAWTFDVSEGVLHLSDQTESYAYVKVT